MATSLDGQIAAVLSALAAAHAHYDLSGTDQVVESSASEPWTRGRPCAAAAVSRVAGATGDVMRHWTRTVRMEVWAWAPATADTPAARALAARRLASDLADAVETAHLTPAGALYALADLSVDCDAMDGQQMHVQGGWGMVVMAIEWSYLSDGGL